MAPRRGVATSSDPVASNWTFLLKYKRTTVLLHHPPTESLYSLRQKLLKALRSASSSKSLEDTLDPDSLPTDPKDVLLGVPIDNDDISQGFMDLEVTSAGLSSALAKDSRGKRRRINGNEGSRVSDISEPDDGPDLEDVEVLNETPRMAGLRDNQVLAFRFRPVIGDSDDQPGSDDAVGTPGRKRNRQPGRSDHAPGGFDVEMMNAGEVDADEEDEDEDMEPKNS